MVIEPKSHFAMRGGVRLHYIVAGQGDVVLFVHGIPDFCSGWRPQIAALSSHYRAAAMDLRGFNHSDKPADSRAYRMAELVEDVTTVIRTLGSGRVTLVGHDWGAILAWWVVLLYPQLVSRLAVLSAPHPLCYISARNRGDLRYSAEFLSQIMAAAPGAPFDVVVLSAWISDPAARRELAEGLSRSDPEAIRNYYRVNLAEHVKLATPISMVKVPTLIMFGARDKFIPERYYVESATYVSAPTKLVSIPDAGHFIHREAAECVNMHLIRWLTEVAETKPTHR